MPFIFPTRTLSSSTQNHLDDHNSLASLLDRVVGFTLTSTRQEHLDEHNAIHSIFSLPSRSLGDSAAAHLADHSTMHSDIVLEYAGVRGTVGPRAPSAIPEYPQSGLVSILPGTASIQSAITANGNGTKFQLQAGTYSINTELNPKAGQEFWGAEGVIISGGGVRQRGWVDLGSRNGVKIQNMTMSGFTGGAYDTRAAIFQPRPGASADWDMGYLEVSGDTTNAKYGMYLGTGIRSRIHHSKLHDFAEGCIAGHDSVDCITEDNELSAGGGTNGQKWLGQDGNIVRHNWIHHMNGCSVWHDANNRDCSVEWNKIEDQVDNGEPAIEFEISGNFTGTTNRIKYNLVRNNNGGAVLLATSQNTEIAYNVFTNNGLTLFAGNAYEVNLFLTQAALDLVPGTGGVAFDLKDNLIFNNVITVRQDGANAKAGQMAWVGATGPTNPTPYLDNIKNNTWTANTYDLRVVATDQHFRWGEASANNITYATWLTKPVPGGTQDTGSEAS